MENKIIKNKIKGSIYGFIVADAMGMPYEEYRKSIMEKTKIKPMKKSALYKTESGTFSDETSLMLATIDSINRKKEIDFFDLMDSYSNWLFDGKYTTTKKAFGILETVFNSINKYKNGIEPTFCGDDFEENSDVSAIIRILPITLYLCKNFSKEFYNNDDALYYLFNFVELTNKQDTNMIGIFYFSYLITKLLEGKTLLESIDNSISFIKKEFSKEDCFYKFNRLLNIKSLKKEELTSKNNIISLLEAVTYALLNNKNYDETILFLIELGGKTDSYSAVGGAICGLYYGYENINKQWIETLKGKKLIDNIVQNFLDNF